MKKKFWIFILCLAILLVIIAAITTNSSRQETGITALYSEETGQITVYAARSSNKHEHYEYRTEGKKIVALSSHYVEDGTDVFVFDIIGNGTEKLHFLIVDPQNTSGEYYGYALEIAITDDVISLNNMLWRRN